MSSVGCDWTPKTCTPLPTTADSSTYTTLDILTAHPKCTALQFQGRLEQRADFTFWIRIYLSNSRALQTSLHSILQHTPPGVFRIVNIYPIHKHCEHCYIFITAYSPCGYNVISRAYWAASHQRTDHRQHRWNLTERISGLKPPYLFLFLIPNHSIGPHHAHFTYRALKPDRACDLVHNNRVSRYLSMVTLPTRSRCN